MGEKAKEKKKRKEKQNNFFGTTLEFEGARLSGQPSPAVKRPKKIRALPEPKNKQEARFKLINNGRAEYPRHSFKPKRPRRAISVVREAWRGDIRIGL